MILTMTALAISPNYWQREIPRGVFIPFEKPIRDTPTDAGRMSFHYMSGWNKDFPPPKILTIEDLFSGKREEPGRSSGACSTLKLC